MGDTVKKCTVRDGRFVEPCSVLSEATDILQPSFSKKKGLWRVELYDREKGGMTRAYHGVRTDKFNRSGILFNFCPFCGVEIDGPVRGDEE